MLTPALKHSISPHIGGAIMGYDGGQVYQHGKRWYYQLYWNGKREKFWNILIYGQWLTISTRATAEKVKKAICLAIDNDREGFDPRSFKPNNPLGIGLYYKTWLDQIDVTAKTRRDYKTALVKYAIPFFGVDKDIRKFKKAELARFLKSLESFSQDYRFNVMGALKSMIRWAWSNEEIKGVPPFPKMSKNDSGDIEYLTLDQQEQNLAHIPPQDAPIFRFAMEYGLRVGEVRAIKKGAIKNGKVWIERRFSDNELIEGTKTPLKKKETRSYDLTPYAKDIIASVWNNESEFLFTRGDLRPYTNKNLNHIWNQACGKSGIRIKLYNAFRHSLGCQLLEEGKDLSFVQEVLGHKTSAMTRRYAKRTAKKIAQVLSMRRKPCGTNAVQMTDDNVLK